MVHQGYQTTAHTLCSYLSVAAGGLDADVLLLMMYASSKETETISVHTCSTTDTDTATAMIVTFLSAGVWLVAD